MNIKEMAPLCSTLPPEQNHYSGRALHLRTKPRVDLLEDSDFLFQKNGEDERFRGSPFRVAAKTLRHRPEDLLNATELARKHAAYRWRIIIGPCSRAQPYLTRPPF